MPNIFSEIDADANEEVFTDLLKKPGVRIERIVSTGQASPSDYWYDQDWDEWVMVLSGSAKLTIEGKVAMTMEAGDYIILPAHTRHRVDWTDPGEPTVWLAVHIGEKESG